MSRSESPQPKALPRHRPDSSLCHKCNDRLVVLARLTVKVVAPTETRIRKHRRRSIGCSDLEG
jgi:hypothetical protein